MDSPCPDSIPIHLPGFSKSWRAWLARVCLSSCTHSNVGDYNILGYIQDTQLLLGGAAWPQTMWHVHVCPALTCFSLKMSLNHKDERCVIKRYLWLHELPLSQLSVLFPRSLLGNERQRHLISNNMHAWQGPHVNNKPCVRSLLFHRLQLARSKC